MLGSVDALSTLRGNGQKDSVLEGLHLLQATSTEPNPVKFKLIGTELNIDAGMFDIPVSVYPICKGDQFLAYPLVGSEHQRWGIVAKITGSGRTGIMTGSNSCKVDGVAVTYGGGKIMAPKSAKSGDRVWYLRRLSERRKAFGSKAGRRRSYSLRPVDNKCRQCFCRRRGR